MFAAPYKEIKGLQNKEKSKAEELNSQTSQPSEASKASQAESEQTTESKKPKLTEYELFQQTQEKLLKEVAEKEQICFRKKQNKDGDESLYEALCSHFGQESSTRPSEIFQRRVSFALNQFALKSKSFPYSLEQYLASTAEGFLSSLKVVELLQSSLQNDQEKKLNLVKIDEDDGIVIVWGEEAKKLEKTLSEEPTPEKDISLKFIKGKLKDNLYHFKQFKKTPEEKLQEHKAFKKPALALHVTSEKEKFLSPEDKVTSNEFLDVKSDKLSFHVRTTSSIVIIENPNLFKLKPHDICGAVLFALSKRRRKIEKAKTNL